MSTPEDAGQEPQAKNSDAAGVQNNDEITIDLGHEDGEDEHDDDEAMKAAMGFSSFQSSTSSEYYSKVKHGAKAAGSSAAEASRIAHGVPGAASGSASAGHGRAEGSGNVMPVHLSKRRRVGEAGAREGEEHGELEVEQQHGQTHRDALSIEQRALFKESFILDPWEGLLPRRLPPLK